MVHRLREGGGAEPRARWDRGVHERLPNDAALRSEEVGGDMASGVDEGRKGQEGQEKLMRRLSLNVINYSFSITIMSAELS